MNRSRTLLIAIAAIGALTLSSCSGGTDVGTDLDTNIKVRATETPTKKPKKKPTKTATATPTQTAQRPAGAEPKERSVAAVNGYQFDPAEFQARVGDPVTFTNSATDSSDGHSFVIDDTDVDSGAKKTGESFTFDVELDPGQYTFRCGIVPYMVSGRLIVFQ